MTRFAAVVAASLVLTVSVQAADKEKEGKKAAPVLSFTMKGLDGKPVDLAQYQGKVVLIVNVASKCGLTPQYEGLQALYAKYQKEGLVIVGVPANEFGEQEPGSDKEIKEFCTKNYNVTFPMLSKVVVKGDGKCDLYKFLTSKDTNPKFAGEIQWNFTKFLINRNGEIVNRYEPRITPEAIDRDIKAEVEKK